MVMVLLRLFVLDHDVGIKQTIYQRVNDLILHEYWSVMNKERELEHFSRSVSHDRYLHNFQGLGTGREIDPPSDQRGNEENIKEDQRISNQLFE